MGLTDYTIGDKRIWNAGRDYEREQIRARIMERVTDLKNCSDDDDCQLFSQFLESYIPEWLGEEE